MTNFWNGKTLHNVAREYLIAALDDMIGSQPMSVEGIVKELCGNITIKNNVKTFVADYFDDAIDTVAECHPENSFRYSQYERVANMMLMRAAEAVLSECEVVREYSGSYHIWKVGDVESLKEELEDSMDTEQNFKRACDVNFESLESYAYRFLAHVLPQMKGKTVELKDLAIELPLVSLSETDSRNFLKCNFNEAMELLDAFRDSGYKVNYANPTEMIQNIMYQKQKEILSENPYMIDVIEYSDVKSITLDEDFLDNLTDSLTKQKENIKLSKFEELSSQSKKQQMNNIIHFPNRNQQNQMGRIIDLRKANNRVEIIY